MHKILGLTSWSSASSISSPGIPDIEPAGPVLTYFSTVVCTAFVGDIELNGEIDLNGDFLIVSVVV